MVAENFTRTLRAFTKLTPFKSFTVELVSGDRIQVDHPEALVFRGGVAVFISADGTPTIFDHEGVAQVTGETERAASA